MPRVLEVIDCRKQNGLFGIEIEVEGRDLPVENVGGWKKVDDGSLRGVFPGSRCENVLANPVPKDQAKYLVLALEKSHKDAKVDMSFRTSVHVHMNVQQLYHCELSTLLYTYTLLEPLLMKFCGDERIGNRFCLRTVDAEGVIDSISMIVSRGSEYAARMSGELRYSAINLAALPKYGSLEFRGMRGTLDSDILHKWLDILDSLRVYAVNIRSPKVVQDVFQKTPFVEFVSNIFGDALTKTLMYQGAEDDCILQHSISIEIPFAYRDLDSGEREGKPRKTIKEQMAEFVQDPPPAPRPAPRPAPIRPRRQAQVPQNEFDRIIREHAARQAEINPAPIVEEDFE